MKHIIQENFIVNKLQRREKHNHHSFVLWFTGLPSSGKSTIAKHLEHKLHKKEYKTYALDGDNIRSGLNNDLGFSAKDRKENIRRIAEMSKLFVDSGTIVTTSFISPYEEERTLAREILDDKEFIEIYVKAPIKVCEKRDVKGLYKKARAGIIKEFTGIDAPYEEPENPELIIETDKLSVEDSVKKIINYLKENKFI